MTDQEILQILADTNVLKEGHFILTSGKHSEKYMQCAMLFQYPEESKKCCEELSKRILTDGIKIDTVVSPAIGGILMGYEMSDCLGVRNIFAERENGTMTFRRGFEVKPGEKVIVCEDVVTTGGSVKEVIKALEEKGADVVCVCSIVDRSGGKADFGVPFKSLVTINFDTYEPEDCPLCKSGKQAIKPGSRNV